MAYQPKVKKSGGYISGVAKFLSRDGKFGVVFSSRKKDDGTPVNGDQAGKSYVVNKWPEYLTPERVDGQICYVKLNSKGDEIYSASPQDGVVELVFTGFGSKEDQEPAPKNQPPDKWGNDYTTATVIFEITGGEAWMLGMPQFMTVRPSVFIPDDEGHITIKGWKGNNKAIHGPRLNEFLTVFGGWDSGPVEDKYVANPLPLFQKRMLAVRKKVKANIHNGFIQSFYASVEEDEFEEAADWGTDKTEEQPFGEPEVTDVAMFEEDDDF